MARLQKAVVVAYGRSAIARSGKKGALRGVHPADLGGEILAGVLKKIPQLDPSMIEDVIVGCAQQEMKQGYNLGRQIVSAAHLPCSVPGMTLTRLCSSGLQTIALAAAEIEAGMSEIIVAGGVESMTAVPMNMDRSAYLSARILAEDPDQYLSMGLTAENVAARHGITREEMESLAVESHRKAAAAQDAGKFDAEIIPVEGMDIDGNPILFDKDQGIRRTTSMEALAGLKPCFREDGIVTAGTSSQTSDGAGFVVLMSEEKARELSLEPIAHFIGFAVAGCEPGYMGEGPIYAVPKVMAQTGLTVDDMDVIELNEAFAAQAIPCMRTLKMNPDKVNPNGGALALGHPLGATGAFLSCKILSELRRTGGRYGLVTMCVGGGMGAAGIYEMC